MKQCELSEQRRAEILLSNGRHDGGAHLRNCEFCAQAAANQAALWKVLDQWNVPEVSSSFNRKLFAKIDAAQNIPWHERFTSAAKGFFAQPSLALGVAALVIFGGFVLDHRTETYSRQATQIPAAQVSNTEAEQVEKTLDDLDMLRQFDLNSGEEKETTSKSM